MSVLSDVHVTYNGLLDGCAITRFRFDYRGLNNENKQEKTAKKKNSQEPKVKRTLPEIESKFNPPSGISLAKLSRTAVYENEETAREFMIGKSEKDQADDDKCKGTSSGSQEKDEQIQSLSNTGEQQANSSQNDECSCADYDSDGDIKLTRKRNHSDSDSEDEQSSLLYITIKHSLATDLEAVGEQVWQGALLLCDFVCDHRSEFKGQCVVDLGAGTGLTSIITAMFADHVFCTDTGDSVLNLALSNINSATEVLQYQQPLCPIDVKDLDWFRDFSDSANTDWSQGTSQYSLSHKDLVDMKHAMMFIAADVIYDDEITDAFFSTVKFFMSEPPNKTLFIGIERRLVFTIADLDISSPCYNHFKHHLEELVKQDLKSPVKFTVEQIDTDFKQFFQYSRTGYLELWKITSSIEKT